MNEDRLLDLLDRHGWTELGTIPSTAVGLCR
jgi:hypothetical protein